MPHLLRYTDLTFLPTLDKFSVLPLCGLHLTGWVYKVALSQTVDKTQPSPAEVWGSLIETVHAKFTHIPSRIHIRHETGLVSGANRKSQGVSQSDGNVGFPGTDQVSNTHENFKIPSKSQSWGLDR